MRYDTHDRSTETPEEEMVKSIDDVRPDETPMMQAAPVSGQSQSAPSTEPRQDLYAEAELRLRHERTERFIERASRELA